MTDYLHNSDEVCTAHLQGLSSLQHTLPLPGHLHNHPTIMWPLQAQILTNIACKVKICSAWDAWEAVFYSHIRDNV